MINRYTCSEQKLVWSEDNKLRLWVEVEAAVATAWEGLDTRFTGLSERIARITVDQSGLMAIEERTYHDVEAFVEYLCKLTGSSLVHYGLTSSDVVDTALSLQIGAASVHLVDNLLNLHQKLRSKSEQHTGAVMGRTHGRNAEPTTWGWRFASWAAEVERGRRRINGLTYGKVAGPVGCFTSVPQRVEVQVCRILGLIPEPVSTQVIPRDRHAEVVQSLALCAAGMERIALNIRLLSQSGIDELSEPFADGQVGSSSMPHKRNPVRCERVCGLSRVVRAYASAALENVSLWNERDISHSSVERIILPDAFSLVCFMAHELTYIIENLVIDQSAVQRNLDDDRTRSQIVFRELLDQGLGRIEAYQIVQQAFGYP